MAHNVSRAFWPSDLTTPVIPPPMLTQENLSVDHAPSTPYDGTSITVPDPAVPQRAVAPPDTATPNTTASTGVHSLQQALPEATAAGEDHPCPADSTAATAQQQRLPEEPTTTAQQSTSEDRQQTAEQPVTTTLQQAQVETEDQFQSGDPRETTDHSDSGQDAEEQQKRTHENTDEVPDRNTYADVVKSPQRQIATPAKDTPTQTVGNYPSVSQPPQQHVRGDSPVHARDARPQTAQVRSRSEVAQCLGQRHVQHGAHHCPARVCVPGRQVCSQPGRRRKTRHKDSKQAETQRQQFPEVRIKRLVVLLEQANRDRNVSKFLVGMLKTL